MCESELQLQQATKQPVTQESLREQIALVRSVRAHYSLVSGRKDALMIDRAGFEAYAKIILKRGPIDGLDVKQIERVSATIAKDLGE